MPCLHLVSRAQALAECLSVAADEDSVLLLGKAALLADSGAGRALLVLEDEVPAGLSPTGSITLIDYSRFVELAATHQPIITWR